MTDKHNTIVTRYNGETTNVHHEDEEIKQVVIGDEYIVVLTGNNCFGPEKHSLQTILRNCPASSGEELAVELAHDIESIDAQKGCFISVVECFGTDYGMGTHVYSMSRENGCKAFIYIENVIFVPWPRIFSWRNMGR